MLRCASAKAGRRELVCQPRCGTRFGSAAVSVDRGARQVLLSSGESLQYRHLVLTTGARPRTLGIPGAGEGPVYDWQPYFCTDQFDLGMEYVGHAGRGDDVVIRGGLEDGEFIAFWIRDDRIRAAMNVNIWDVNDDLRALIGQPADRRRLADVSTPLTEVMSSSRA